MSTIGRRLGRLKSLVGTAAVLALAACAPKKPAAAPTPAPVEEVQEEEPAPPAPLRADVLGPSPASVPPASPSCPAGGPAPTARTCPEFLDQLSRALSHDSAARDGELQGLEACSEAASGLVRALRAELSDARCADVLVASLVDQAASDSNAPALGVWRETLVGLGLGARLRRLASEPPAVPLSRDKAALQAYFKDNLFPWIADQAAAIQALASQGAQLSGYARGVVAVEAGMADMRFVEIARAVPIPVEMEKDRELSEIYYSSLDEALEARKSRGRDGALVGLLELSRVGIHHDARVDSARALLSRVFGGSRVTALDALLLPAVAPLALGSAIDRIAASAPTPYTAVLLGELEWSPELVRSALERGMPVPVLRQLEASADARSRYLGALARFVSGTIYFRREDFQAADAALGSLLDTPDLPQTTRDDATLLRALAVALSAGPIDASALIAKGPRFADALGNFAQLDAVARSKSPHAGRAAYDGAYLRELVAEPGAADTWRDLGARYQQAALKLSGADRKRAQERSQAALATEKAIRKTPR